MKNTLHEIRRVLEWFPERSFPQLGRMAVVVATALLGAFVTPASVQAADPVITDFKLLGDGEYLALARPDGTVLQRF